MALVLAYDELPEGSDIRREMREEGVRIMLPSGGIPESMKLLMYRDSAVKAALVSGGILIILGTLTMMSRQVRILRLSQLEWWLAIVAAVIVAIALFGLVWRHLASAGIEAVLIARRQATALEMNEQRLIIEQTGAIPISATITADELKGMRIERDFQDGYPLPVIEIKRRSGETIRIARGRSEFELCWIINSINAVLAKPVEP